MPPYALQKLQNINNALIIPFLKFLFALAIVIFIWGVVEFILGADNEEKRDAGKRHLVWGLIGLVIMFAVWGLIAVIQSFIKSL